MSTSLSRLLRARNPEGLSGRELGRRAGIGESTGTQYLGGRHPKHPERETLDAIARVLPVTVVEMQRALSAPVDRRHWTPPSEVHTLAPEVQDALTGLIKAMGRQAQRGQTDAGNAEAQKSNELEERRRRRLGGDPVKEAAYAEDEGDD